VMNMAVECWIDGARVGASTAGQMLDGPFGAAAFLLRWCRSRGRSVPAGTWISSGAVTGVHAIQAGQWAEARFGAAWRVPLRIAD
jgi:2-keto-4-pentenoate hydratase